MKEAENPKSFFWGVGVGGYHPRPEGEEGKGTHRQDTFNYVLCIAVYWLPVFFRHLLMASIYKIKHFLERLEAVK